jgi:AAA15 family ATPase/GTPase
LEHYYNVASDKGAIRTIIHFIRQEIDDSIEDIQRVGSGQNFRFNVTFQNQQKRPLDLTEFGDGLQRIFHISLMIVAAQYGIICIDEIENAIHHNLLVKFTEFIQKLAHEYHVQIFASTHSQECIKAFFDNHYKNEEITGFRLERQEKNIQVTKAEGVGFKVLIEDFGLDLRG